LKHFFVLYDFWETKCYFGILDNFVRWTKSCDVVWWGTKISIFVLSLASSLSWTWNNFTNQTL